MKTITKSLIVASLLTLSITAAAQDNVSSSTSSFRDKLMMNVEFGTGTKSHDITPMGLGFQAGYRVVPRLAVFADFQGSVNLYNSGGTKTYFKSTTLGGGLEYKLFSLGNTDFGIQGKIGTSIGNTDWKQTVYDIKLVVRLRRDPSNISFGLGFRHVHSRTEGLKDINGVYATIGFGI